MKPFDANPGPGRHRYRITALRDGLSSFPVAVTLLPHGVPGTFVRGDANVDGRVNIMDAIAVIRYLFLDGPLLACLDAADADDDGSLKSVDVASLLHWLFVGSLPLPPPGPETAWFDPTEDGLEICE